MEPQVPPRHWFRRLVIAFAVLNVVAACAWLGYRIVVPENGIRVEELEADLEASLPDGSTLQEAEAWFASHGLVPGEVYEGNPGRKCGLMKEIPNHTLLAQAYIQINLYFTDGRLTKREIRRVVESL